MSNLLNESSSKVWDRIRKSSFFKPMIDDVLKGAEEFLATPTETLKLSEFNLYYATGNRFIYEKKYFSRRGKLNSYALMYLVTKDKKYLTALEDIIWTICDEFTWALPAHMPFGTPLENQKRWVDLFAAETGYALSEIYHLIGEDFSDSVRERIKYEVRYRIITAYLESVNNQWWETGTNNWAAVCAGSVGVAAMYLGTDEEFEMAKPRLLKTIEGFLSGFGSDGCCLEGYSYWVYGFGFFIQFASLLRQYTNGEINLFSLEKVKHIAAFQQKIILDKNKCASFSDGGMTFAHPIGMTHFLYKEFDGIEIPDIKYMSKFENDHCYRWGTFIRNFLWADENLPACTLSNKNYYLGDAGWYIKRGDDYAFAAKAGDNDEPHNHNDVGSFMILADDNFVLCDLGAGEYVADYFGPLRYDFLVNSSRGHSLPIIDGQYQKEGKNYCGQVISQSDDVFEIEISKAYGIAELNSLKRRFEFNEDRIIINDKYHFSTPPASVTERFITLQKPVVDGSKVLINNKVIEFDNNALTCIISTELYSDHHTNPTTAYLIDFNVKNLSELINCTFTIK